MEDDELLYCGLCEYFDQFHGSAGICTIKPWKCGRNLVDAASEICDRFRCKDDSIKSVVKEGQDESNSNY